MRVGGGDSLSSSSFPKSVHNKKNKLAEQKRAYQLNGKGIQYPCKFNNSEYKEVDLNGVFSDHTMQECRINCRHLAQWVIQYNIFSKSEGAEPYIRLKTIKNELQSDIFSLKKYVHMEI